MAETETSLDRLLPKLSRLAEASLTLWDVPKGARVTLINVSENVTFLVKAPGFKAVLRVHRDGYHARRAIESELDWLTALDVETGLTTPQVISGKNGERIQEGISEGLTAPRHMVLFHFIEGSAPEETGDLSPGFETLGKIAAQCHHHASGWTKPAGFDRMTWDEEAVFGPGATWGDWRAAPGVTSEFRPLLEQVEHVVSARLQSFGKSKDRFNLIHADMRLANLIIAPEGIRLIDFDDCGWGWFLYDFAAAISFLEDDPRIPALKAAWLRGYRSLRALSEEDAAEMDSFIMLRRIALLAWIGSHIDAPEPQALAPTFAANTAKLAELYLENFSLP
ncbi:MAG: phosphotransferase [Pseudomonadota bacterium]